MKCHPSMHAHAGQFHEIMYVLCPGIKCQANCALRLSENVKEILKLPVIGNVHEM